MNVTDVHTYDDDDILVEVPVRSFVGERSAETAGNETYAGIDNNFQPTDRHTQTDWPTDGQSGV